MTKVTIKNNKLINDPIRIGIGQYYKSGDIIYILASVDNKKVILVSVVNGKRWPLQPVEVSNIDNISNEEWDKIRCDSKFELIPEIEIIIKLNSMTQVKINIPPVIKTYHVGQYFQLGEEIYILSRIHRNQVVLIALKDGNRYTNPVYVMDDFNISEEEFKILQGSNKGNFKPVSEITISIP